jgi:hypothetical protein
VKITPINFVTLLEPELISFWENKDDLKGSSIQTKRTHNFKLKQTELTCVAVTKAEHTTVLCQLQLVDIPQQETNASLNCMIHLPDIKSPCQLLMVFKKEEDNSMWVRKIIGRIRSLLEKQGERDRYAELEDEAAKEEEKPSEAIEEKQEEPDISLEPEE